MTGNNKLSSALSASNGPLQANGNINQMLEQLHAGTSIRCWNSFMPISIRFTAC